MPIYEYRCPQCGVFERNQRITESPLTSCPTCGAAVKRLISKNVGIVFKGPGFYVTDNRPAPAETGSATAKPEDSKAADNGGGGAAEKPGPDNSDKLAPAASA